MRCKWVADRQFAIDDPAVLQVFGNEVAAASFQGRGDQHIAIECQTIPRGDDQCAPVGCKRDWPAIRKHRYKIVDLVDNFSPAISELAACHVGKLFQDLNADYPATGYQFDRLGEARIRGLAE